MSEALHECFNRLGGIRTKQEVESWIDKRYSKRWKPGTLRDHLYGGRVNHPLAYQHHPGQKKFLFDHGEHRYELYDADKHGSFLNGIAIPSPEKAALGWILVHSKAVYNGKDPKAPKTPMEELDTDWPGKGGPLLWHWTAPQPYKESSTRRRLLLSGRQEVFGEATATITHTLGEDAPSESNFAFRLESYERLLRPIPFSELQLGNREREHRSVIRLDPEVWAAYEVQKKKLNAERPKIEIEACVNPQKARQGYGLTAKERKCVELRAMELAEAYLSEEEFDYEDLSRTHSFDYQATRGKEVVSVEVKGTTGLGDTILLTASEVEHQKRAWPRNMLIVVHSIKLKKGDVPEASGGVLEAISPWEIAEDRLEPTAFAYAVPRRAI